MNTSSSCTGWLQNETGDLPVLFKDLCEDEDVIQIDHDYTFQDEVLKDVVHHRLESGGTVREAEEHDNVRGVKAQKSNR